jgi:hypothetical protein
MLEEDGEGLRGEGLPLGLAVHVVEKGFDLLAPQAGEGEFDGDAAPEGKEAGGQEPVFEFRESGEDDGEEGRPVKVGFGEEADLVEGVLADQLGFVDPEQEAGRQGAEMLHEEPGHFGAGALEREMQGIGQDAGEGGGRRAAVTEVQQGMAASVETGGEVPEEGGFAGAGFAQEQGVGVMAEGAGQEIVGAPEILVEERGGMGGGWFFHEGDSLCVGARFDAGAEAFEDQAQGATGAQFTQGGLQGGVEGAREERAGPEEIDDGAGLAFVGGYGPAEGLGEGGVDFRESEAGVGLGEGAAAVSFQKRCQGTGRQGVRWGGQGWRWRRFRPAGKDRLQRDEGALVIPEPRRVGMLRVQQGRDLFAVLERGGQAEGGAPEFDGGGAGTDGTGAFFEKGFEEALECNRARGAAAAEGLLGRGADLSVRMGLIQEVDDGVEEILKVGEVADGLVFQFLDEPAPQDAMIGLDLPVGLWIAGLGADAADAQDGQAESEDVGIVAGVAVGIEAVGQAPLGGGMSEGGDGGGEAFAFDDPGSQRGARGIVEDREDGHFQGRAVDEGDGEGGLGVGLPDLVGAFGLKADADPGFSAGAPAQGSITRFGL